MDLFMDFFYGFVRQIFRFFFSNFAYFGTGADQAQGFMCVVVSCRHHPLKDPDFFLWRSLRGAEPPQDSQGGRSPPRPAQRGVKRPKKPKAKNVKKKEDEPQAMKYNIIQNRS